MAWGSNKCDFRGNLIYSTSASFNVFIMNTGSATRVNRPPFNDSVLDLSFSSSSLSWSLSWRTLDDFHGSDHFPIIIDYESSSPIINKNVTSSDNLINPNVFNFNKANWSKFYDWLDHFFRSSYPFSSSGPTYNECIELLFKAARIAIPYKKVRRTFIKSPIWWNSDCIVAIKSK